MTARWNVCRANRIVMCNGTHTYHIKKMEHFRKLVMFCSRVSASSPLCHSFFYISSQLHTPTNEWIIEFVYVQYQVTMSLGITKIDVYLFLNFHIIFTQISFFLRVFFFLLISFTEKWVLFVLYFPLNALNKRGKVRDQNTCTHARTSTLTHECENKCENIK